MIRWTVVYRKYCTLHVCTLHTARIDQVLYKWIHSLLWHGHVCADLVREEDPRKYTPDQVSIAQVKNRQFSVTVSSLGQYHKDVSCGRGAKNLWLISQVLAPIKGFVLCVLTVDWVSSSAAGGSQVTIVVRGVHCPHIALSNTKPRYSNPSRWRYLGKIFSITALNFVRKYLSLDMRSNIWNSRYHLVFENTFELEV